MFPPQLLPYPSLLSIGLPLCLSPLRLHSLQLKQSKKYLRDGEERFREALMILDYRFFLIPVMFALLRMWTCMLFIFEVYTQVKGIPLPVKIMVGYLSVSTGGHVHIQVHHTIQMPNLT